MKKVLITHTSIFVLLALVAFAFLASSAGAFDQYSTSRTAGNCADCHGNFRATAPYFSQHDGVAWKDPSTGVNLNLHDGHRNYMLSGDCNVCHTASSRFPVLTNASAGGSGFPAIGCTGCHVGDGLREHHVNSGAATCFTSTCHTNPGTPPAENVKPPYYFTPDAAHPNKPNDPCNANGSESAVAPPLGLDNDGNLLYDGADPACKVAAPVLSVSPTTPLAFGNQNVGTTSAAQTVTLTNTGNAVLTVSSISNSNSTDFSITTPTMPFNVAAGANQTFTVAFKPTTAGGKSATISITSNGGNGSVSATGTGVTAPVPILGVSPTTLNFGNQTIGTTSAAQTVTISNTGTATLNVTTITSNSAEFKFSPATISPIVAGGSATLSVTFAPVAPAGAKSGTISITSDGGNASVSVTGTAVAPTVPVMSVSPTTLSFGNQDVGTTSAAQTVTISNTGTAALTVNSISNSNATDFVLTAPATPLNIAVGGSQTFTVAFKPTSIGAKTATISITSNGGNASVAASGTGTTAPVGGDDVSLVKLIAPAQIAVRGSGSLEIDAFATTTAHEIDATVTLAAAPGSGVTVQIDHTRITEEVEANDLKKFGFEAKVVCTRKGTWPVTWTATISAAQNSNLANDTLTGNTQVTCTTQGGERDRED